MKIMDFILMGFIMIWFIVGLVIAVLFNTVQYTEIVNIIFLGIMVLFTVILAINDKVRKWCSKNV